MNKTLNKNKTKKHEDSKHRLLIGNTQNGQDTLSKF